jgi:hypothetical protein
MPSRLRKLLLRASLAGALCALAAGCATSGDMEMSQTKATAVPARAAESGIVVGKSTKADVLSALGKTTAITFDSGYEVWVYHLEGSAASRSERSPAEFVVLFNPSGVVAKTRTRIPPARA